jgi:hypothetical protein
MVLNVPNELTDFVGRQLSSAFAIKSYKVT